MDSRRRTLNDIITTIFLLNVGTVIYIFFILLYDMKKTSSVAFVKKIWL